MSVGAAKLHATTYGALLEKSTRSEVRVSGVSVVDLYFYVYLSGVVVAFLIFIGDFVPPLTSNVPALAWVDRENSIHLVALLFMGPCACMNEMNWMATFGQGSMLVVVFTCCVVIAKSVPQVYDKWDLVVESWNQPIHFSWASLRALGCMFYAFDIGSVVPPTACEMKDQSLSGLVSAAIYGTVGVAIAYIVLAFSVFFSFLGHEWEDGHVGTRSDFTENYGDEDSWMSICRFLLVWTFVCSSTLAFVPGLKSLYICVGQFRGLGDDWEPEMKVRIMMVYGTLVPVALVAAKIPNVGKVVTWLGCVCGAPEILVGPLLLVAWGHVFKDRLMKVVFAVFAIGTMCLLWASSFEGQAATLPHRRL